MNAVPRHFFEFDAYRVDVEERQLWRSGVPVTLTPKAFDILVALVQNSGQTVDKSVLIRTVWPDAFVEEGNLNHHISTLRKILGDGRREQRFIKTIPKSGYRFTAAVREIVESDETLSVEKLSRASVVIREETQEWFWTPRRIVIATALVVSTVAAVGAWALSGNFARSQARTRWTSNAEAAEAFTRGRSLWQTRKAGDLHRATLLLERAVELDPNFALAHAALADAYAFDYSNWKKAEAVANEAIRLDPNLGEPHATLGFIRMFWDWKLAGAEKEFKRAVTLSPNYATGHQWYSINLAATGHTDAALAEIKRAAELEPDSPSISADLCRTLYFMPKYDEAIAQCQKLLAADPENLNAYLHLFEIYVTLQMYAEAIETSFKIEELSNYDPMPNSSEKLREAYAKGGARGFLHAQAERLSVPTAQAYKLAQTYARLGNSEKAIYWLVEAARTRDFELVIFAADPAFLTLRGDRRLEPIWEQIKD